MPTEQEAFAAIRAWWRGMRERPVDSVSLPCSQDVVGRFLQEQPEFRSHEAALREWARSQTWVISSTRWKAITGGH